MQKPRHREEKQLADIRHLGSGRAKVRPGSLAPEPTNYFTRGEGQCNRSMRGQDFSLGGDASGDRGLVFLQVHEPDAWGWGRRRVVGVPAAGEDEGGGQGTSRAERGRKCPNAPGPGIGASGADGRDR